MTATSAPSRRPDAGEYAPYYEKYVRRVPEGDVCALLEAQHAETLRVFADRDDAWALRRYEPGKWSVKEVLAHISDTERIMAYRALRIARGDVTPLPGFEQDEYVRGTDFDRIPLHMLRDELVAVRGATVALFRNLGSDAWTRRGTASSHEVSVRALAYIILGHERHHLEILQTRYR